MAACGKSSRQADKPTSFWHKSERVGRGAARAMSETQKLVFAKSEAISGDVISFPRRSVEQLRKGRKPLIRTHCLLISFSCCEYFANDFCTGASSDLQPADVQIAYSNGRVFPRAPSFFNASALVFGVDSSVARAERIYHWLCAGSLAR